MLLWNQEFQKLKLQVFCVWAIFLKKCYTVCLFYYACRLCLSSSFLFFLEIILSHNAEKLGKFEKSSLLGFYDFGRTFFATCTVAGFLLHFSSSVEIHLLKVT